MLNRNLWNKNVSRVEYDHRARDARRRLEQVERLLTKPEAAGGFRYFKPLLLLFGKIAGSGRLMESSDDQWPCHIGARGQYTRTATLRVVKVWQP